MKRKELKRAGSGGLWQCPYVWGLRLPGDLQAERRSAVQSQWWRTAEKGPSLGWMKREKAAAGAMEETWC